jgi:maltooligosyltrehalose trehalohydrolase
VDALRLDAVHALVDTRALPILEELSAETARLSESLGRPLTLIAESDLNDPRVVTPRADHGLGMDAQWSDDLHHALHVRLTGETDGYYADFGAPGALAKTLRGAFFHDGSWSSFREHTHGRPVDTRQLAGTAFLAYLQNHDQIGNRATGDRISATIPPGLQACGAAIVLLGPYTPMLFMGEEWAASTPWQFFASFPDPELAEAVRTGRRREFSRHGWGEEEVPDPMDPATVERSTLNWSEIESPEHAEMLGLYRSLIALRREHPELSDPSWDGLVVDVADNDSWLVMHRGSLRVAINFGDSNVELDLGVSEALSAYFAVTITDGVVSLPPESFAVLR